jgi:hypothetical protein
MNISLVEMKISKLIKWFNERVLKWVRYYNIQINNLSWQKCQPFLFISSIHKIVQQTSYHKSTKGRRLSFLSTWRPTIDSQNSSQFVWAGLAWVTFYFIVWCKRKRRRGSTSPSCSQDQDKVYPWRTNVTHEHSILLFTRPSQLSLTN